MKRHLINTVLLVSLVAVSGCGTGKDDMIGPFPPQVQGENFTPDEMIAKVKLSQAETHSSLRLAEMRAAEVYVIQTTGELRPEPLDNRDQVFFIVRGQCISNVQGTRDVVGPGSVIVAPRGVPVRFIRGPEDAGKPLLVVRVVSPNEGFKERPSLPAPEIKAAEGE